MITGSPVEIVAFLLAPSIGLLALVVSRDLRESQAARRVLGAIGGLALVEAVWFLLVLTGAGTG